MPSVLSFILHTFLFLHGLFPSVPLLCVRLCMLDADFLLYLYGCTCGSVHVSHRKVPHSPVSSSLLETFTGVFASARNTKLLHHVGVHVHWCIIVLPCMARDEMQCPTERHLQ